jgi:hypothetical protein
MPQVSLACPHCRTERVGFSPRGAVQVKPGHPQTLIFLQCEACGQGVIAVVVNGMSNVQSWIIGNSSSPGIIAAVFPEIKPLDRTSDLLNL